MSKFRRVFNNFIGFLMLCGISYCVYNFSAAETRVMEICSQIKPGMPISELRDFGTKYGLDPTTLSNASGVNYMVETKTYGRYGCKVIIESGKVKSSAYHFAS